jgi:hypothetical protein
MTFPHRATIAAICAALANVSRPAAASDTSIEFGHILACQVSDASSTAYGAINDVWGNPTWVVPGEVAVASWVLNKGGYTTVARAAAGYLVGIQNPDGSWCNRYSGTVATDSGKYARHTAQIMVLLKTLGGYDAALAKANVWLQALGSRATKGGNDDGLICGGYDSSGNALEDRWTSDNSFAVAAFAAAGNTAARDGVVKGINTNLVNGDHWMLKIDKNGVGTDGPFGWISFAPAFMSLGVFGVSYPQGLAAAIHNRLQVASGSDAGAVYENDGSTKYMPGIGFQASIAWNELGAPRYTDAHTAWAETRSVLWQTTPDVNGDAGGWIDWKLAAGGSQANGWERFIGTSAYYIMAVNRWKFFEPVPSPAGRPFSESAVVYPNPAAGDRVTVSLELDADADEVTMDVYNSAMLRVYTGSWTGVSAQTGEVQISGIRRWAPGHYLIRARAKLITGAAQSFSPVKLVIKR